jgi:class 3 adenylate cyclase
VASRPRRSCRRRRRTDDSAEVHVRDRAHGRRSHYGSELVEVRGDEALLVFTSARAAIGAGVDLQARFREASEELEIPLRVGIGIDSGEAVQLEDA